MAAEVAPDEPGPVLLYAFHLRDQERPEEAESLFRRVTEIIEPGFASHAALGAFLASQDREEDAEASFRQALELAEPEERNNAYTVLANFLITEEREDDAEAVMLEGIDKLEDDVELIYTLTRYYHVQGRREPLTVRLVPDARDLPETTPAPGAGRRPADAATAEAGA